MRILMLAHRMPSPPWTGDKVRAYHVARHLSRHHELTLACTSDEPGLDAALARLRRDVPDVEVAPIARTRKRLGALVHLARGGSATMRYFDVPALHRRIAARLRRRIDLIYVSASSMWPYVPRGCDVPTILDFVDVDSEKWLRYARRLSWPTAWLYRLEGGRLRRDERAAARDAACCLVATRDEEALLRALAPSAATAVMPNGVDLDYFTPAPSPGTEPRVAFTGAMDYFPNVDAAVYFAEEVLPRIRDRVPAVRFTIVGKNPVRAVRRLATLPGVAVTGRVADVRPYLRGSAVAVAPMRLARGVQNKVLEAMAMGLPVVATPEAHEGLDARPGEHLFVAHGAAALADAVTRLLHDARLRADVGRAARAFVEIAHRWSASLATLDGLVESIAGATAAPAARQGT